MTDVAALNLPVLEDPKLYWHISYQGMFGEVISLRRKIKIGRLTVGHTQIESRHAITYLEHCDNDLITALELGAQLVYDDHMRRQRIQQQRNTLEFGAQRRRELS